MLMIQLIIITRLINFVLKKHCPILSIDDYYHSKMFISKKNCKYYGVDVNHFEFFDEDYENYGYDDYY